MNAPIIAYPSEMFDTIWIDHTATTVKTYTFFQTPQGQGTSPTQKIFGVTAGAKSRYDTSFKQAGILPNNTGFIAMALGITVINNIDPKDTAATGATDAVTVIQGGRLTLHADSQDYELGLIADWAGGNNLVAQVAGGTTNAAIQLGYAVNNGTPSWAGIRRLDSSGKGWGFEGGTSLTLELNLPVLPTGDIALQATFFGMALKPAY